MSKNHFISSRLKSFGYAFKGLAYLLKNEINFQIHCIATIVITILGFYYNLSPTEWLIQCLAITLVLTTEVINSAIEKSLDAIHPNKHPKIGLAKDIAAGAVLLTAIFALIVGGIIYIPKLILV